jgi:hypothetical protein
MKIAFCGDSFCASMAKGSYLTIIQNHYKSDPYLTQCDQRGIQYWRGQEGKALYHSYESLLELLWWEDSKIDNHIDCIVFCITSADRLATKYNMPCMLTLLDYYLDPAQDLNSQDPPGSPTELDNFLEDYELAPAPVKGKAKENGRKILQAARDFYEHLYDEEYFKSIQVGLLMQIDRLMIQKKKKCIWFTCIDNLWTKKNWPEYYPIFIPKSGPYGNEALYDISMSEDDIPDLERIGFDPRSNHLNAENNIRLANLIINIIETDRFDPYEIKMEQYFKSK